VSRIGKIVFIGAILLFFNIVFSSRVGATIIFSISNPTLNENDEIEVDAVVSGLISSSCSTTGCYLQGQLQSSGGYFGYTYNNSGEYVDYFKNPGSIDELKSKLFNFTPVSGAWIGKLRVKNNPGSQNYYGPGDYLLSFRRFSGNSLSPTSSESNGLSVSLTLPVPTPIPTINILSTPTPTPIPTLVPTEFPLKTPPPTVISTNTQTPKPTPTAKLSPTPIKTLLPLNTATGAGYMESSQAFQVLGTESGETSNDFSGEKTKSGKRLMILPTALIILGVLFIGAAIFSIIKKGKIDYTDDSEKQNS